MIICISALIRRLCRADITQQQAEYCQQWFKLSRLISVWVQYSLAWNFRMSYISNGRLWLVAAASTVAADTAANWLNVVNKLCLLTMSAIQQIIFAYQFRQVWSYDKEVITLFSYRHLYQALGWQLPSAMCLGPLSTLGLDKRADIKTAVW